MSRVAKQIVVIPTGVTVTVGADAITVKGAKGALSLPLAEGVTVKQERSSCRSATPTTAMRARAPVRRVHTWPT
jgi:large subunit ribosomal protein L6